MGSDPGASGGQDAEATSLVISHPAVEAPFTLAQLCDLQLWMPGRALSGGERARLRRDGCAGSLGSSDDAAVQLVDAIAATGPELVLVPGDLIDSYESGAIDFCAQVLSRFQVPVHITLGNHDICTYEPPGQWTDNSGDAAEEIRRVWRRRLGMERFTYSFRHRGVRFIALDTSESRLFPADVDWLGQDLAADGHTPTVLFYHVPAPIPSLLPEVARHRARYYCLARDESTRRFMGLIEACTCVLAGLCGHVHFASAHRWGSMIQTTMPPSCDGGYRLVTVTP